VAVAGRGTLSECPLKGIDLPLVAGDFGLRAQGTYRLILGSEAQTSMMGHDDWHRVYAPLENELEKMYLLIFWNKSILTNKAS
jgi:hypothetical protein